MAFLYFFCSRYTLAKVSVISSFRSNLAESPMAIFGTSFCGFIFGFSAMNLSIRLACFLFLGLVSSRGKWRSSISWSGGEDGFFTSSNRFEGGQLQPFAEGIFLFF